MDGAETRLVAFAAALIMLAPKFIGTSLLAFRFLAKRLLWFLAMELAKPTTKAG
jgi:hypothetical protein